MAILDNYEILWQSIRSFLWHYIEAGVMGVRKFILYGGAHKLLAIVVIMLCLVAIDRILRWIWRRIR